MSNKQTSVTENNGQNKKPIFKKWWFWLIIVLVVLLIIGIAVGTSGNGGNEDPSSVSSSVSSGEPAEEAIQISAVDLLAAYDENAVQADNDYKDKLLEVTGIVNSVDRDILNDVYVTINDGGEYSILSVQCYFEDEDEIAKTAELSAGDEVTIVGTCDGETINVIMRDCTIK